MGWKWRLRSLFMVTIFVTGVLVASVPATAVACFPGDYQCPWSLVPTVPTPPECIIHYPPPPYPYPQCLVPFPG